MYKANKCLSPPIITEQFEKKNERQYNLRHNSQFTIPTVNSVYHETENVSFLGPKIWDILPDRSNKIDSLGDFKATIKIGSLRNDRVVFPAYISTMPVHLR